MGELHPRILLRWKNSLWKLIWRQLLIYTLLYLAISFIYRVGLIEEQQKTFEKLIDWVRSNSTGIPLTFLLGFYVNLVVRRWWDQFLRLPVPDEVAIYLKMAFTKNPKNQEEKETDEQEEDDLEEDKNHKDSLRVMRYMILSYILCMRRISSLVRKHYPTMDHLVTINLVTQEEAARIGLEKNKDITKHGGSRWWLPIKWSIDLVRKVQITRGTENAPAYTTLVARITEFRRGLNQVMAYGHVPIPLVYTQVVHLAVYFHFACQLIGDQWKINGDVDLYYPIFLSFKFLFFFGWLKVAQTLVNPYGCHDEDFELIDIIHRHIKYAATFVDQNDLPEEEEELFWKSRHSMDEEKELEKENTIQIME